MIRKVFLFVCIAGLSINMYSQNERKFIRKGNRAFDDKAYTRSEINYRKAVEKEADSYKAVFNMGDALYKQGKYNDAAQKFASLTNRDLSDDKMAKAYHNLGNSFLKSEKLKESIQAYKNALKLNPDDVETKHNLTYALRKLQQQQQQQNKDQQQQDKQNNKNQNQNKDPKQDQKQNNQNQQNQQNKQKQDKQQERQQQPEKNRISKEDAKRLLQALENDEKDLQKKLKKKKAKAKSAKSTKNW